MERGLTDLQDAIYLHPDRSNVAYCIFRLLDSQKRQLLDFLLSDGMVSSLLPILADEKNRQRIDPEESIETTGIYRDGWERKPLSPDVGDRRPKDEVDRLNYPTDEDQEEAQWRAMERKAGQND